MSTVTGEQPMVSSSNAAITCGYTSIGAEVVSMQPCTVVARSSGTYVAIPVPVFTYSCCTFPGGPLTNWPSPKSQSSVTAPIVRSWKVTCNGWQPAVVLGMNWAIGCGWSRIGAVVVSVQPK